MKFIKENWSAIIFTTLVHVVVLALFAVNINFERQVVKPATPVAVQAKIINGAAIDAEIKRQEKLEQNKLDAEMKRQKDLEDKVLQAKKQREIEEKRLSDLEVERKQQELDAEKRQQELAEKEKQAKLDAQKKSDAEKKKLAELEKKRKVEETRLENIKKEQEATKKKAAEEESKRVAAAAAKKKAEEEAKKKAAELAAMKEKEAEAKRLAEEKEAARIAALQADLAAAMEGEESFNQAVNSGAMNRYVLAISQTIERNWRKPPSAPSNLKCILNVKQLPGGDVSQLSFGACNADDVTKASIEKAVFRASPLPEPEDPSIFARDLEVIFEPES